MIDADRADGQVQILDAEAFNNVALQRIARLGAEAPHAVGGVVAAEGGQIHAGDGAKQPRGLRFLLYGAPRYVGGRAPLNGTGVDAHALNPIEIERNVAVGFEGAPIEDDGDGSDSVRRVVIRSDGLNGHGATPQQR